MDHFIRTLDHGYQTMIDGDSGNISQGQKQLLTIARAFLADPKILILDEATSSVDTRTEVLIQKGMETLMKGRTSFIIAHRLSTIRDADLILVMKEGDIVEAGTHDSLMADNGFYASLYNSCLLYTSGRRAADVGDGPGPDGQTEAFTSGRAEHGPLPAAGQGNIFDYPGYQRSGNNGFIGRTKQMCIRDRRKRWKTLPARI